MKNWKWIPLVLTTLMSSLSYANDLEDVEFELKKISEYRKQGLETTELATKEKELLEKQKVLSKKKIVTSKKKELVKDQNANKKNKPQDYLNFAKKLENNEEKLSVILKKLEEERHLLAQEIEKDSNRNSKIIAELRDNIDLLEWKKTIVQKRISDSRLETRAATFKVSGLLDMYYGLSSNRGGNNGQGSDDRTQYHNTLRYYDNKHNDFTINLAEITLSSTQDKTTFLVDFDFGEFAEQNSTNTISKHIGQANLTYDIDGKHSFVAGKMYSHVGYELAKPMENWNYSKPFAFGYGIPFWHEGIALKGVYSSGYRWGAFIYDKTDSHIANSQDKSYGLQAGFVNDKIALLYNGISGSDQNGSAGNKRTIHNINGQYNTSSTLSFAFDWVSGKDQNATDNAVYNGHEDQKWQSLVGYVNWKFTENWRFAGRSEWFAETTDAGPDGTYRLGVDGSVRGPVDITTQTFTLAHNLAQNNELRLEYRLDHANNPIFYNRKNDLRKQQDTVVIAWMLRF